MAGVDLTFTSGALFQHRVMDKDDIQNVSQSRMDTGNWSRTLEGLARSDVTHSLLDPEKSQGFWEKLGSRS